MRRAGLSLDHAIPRLSSPNDEFLATVNILLAVNHNLDRAGRSRCFSTVSERKRRRGYSAAHGRGAPIADRRADPRRSGLHRSTFERCFARRTRASGKTLYALLKADYLDQPKFREVAAHALAASVRGRTQVSLRASLRLKHLPPQDRRLWRTRR